jgi:uncharacterized protein
MDELGDKLSAILNDPDSMERVRQMAQSILGGEDVIRLYPDKTFHIVSGNCDIFSSYPSSDIANIAGHGIFFTHGHTLGVKYGTERLVSAARAAGCDIALYGHTHASKVLYEDGMYVVNPGSCAEPRDGSKSYAVIDIEENGIMPIIIKI